MDLHPQYTYDKNGNAVGVFISIEEWQEIEQELTTGIPEWQKQALDAEEDAIAANPNYLLKWEDVKKQFLG
jgi:hypothetical protein